jgi:glycosyltransferase involved in cell wall biosynthesis
MIPVNNKRSIFFLKRESPELQYGINSFLDTLIPSIVNLNQFNVFLIRYFEPSVTECAVTEKGESFTEIAIPPPLFYVKSHKNDQRYANRVVDILADFFGDAKPAIHSNHVNDFELLRAITTRFMNASLVTSVHCMLIETAFNGNKILIANYAREMRDVKNSYVKKEADLLAMSDYIISVNRHHKMLMHESYGVEKEKIQVIPRGLAIAAGATLANDDKLNVRDRFYINPEDKVILYAGRVDHSKGLKHLVGSLRTILNKNKNFKLIIAGGGNIESLLPYTTDIWTKIVFTGFIEKAQLFALFRSADVGVLPSIYENDSLIAKEMILNKLPLIVSDCDGFTEFFKDQENCLIVKNIAEKNGDSHVSEEDLALAILKMTGDASFSDRVTASAYESLVATGDLEDTVNNYLSIYNKIFDN